MTIDYSWGACGSIGSRGEMGGNLEFMIYYLRFTIEDALMGGWAEAGRRVEIAALCSQ
jgi:hypothetical protein